MFNTVIICCTHGFGDSLVLWASEHVKGLYLGGKTAQQDWLKQNRMARKLPKQGIQCISTEIRSTLFRVHRTPKPLGKDTSEWNYENSSPVAEVKASEWKSKRVSGKLNSKNSKNYTCLRHLPRWFCPSFSFLASREYPTRVNTTKTTMPVYFHYIYIARR